MRFRKLRIAWSLVFAAALVLLIALWVRSYWRLDVVHCPTSRPLIANSAMGVFQFSLVPTNLPIGWAPGWGWMSSTSDLARREVANRPKWSWSNDGQIMAISVPAWSVALAFGFAAVVPWIKPRFSLRTLLIATTLVALILGGVVILGR